MGWQRQNHIYSVPFYYIDYCLAQTVALEFWAMMQEDYEGAWEHYMAYTRQGGTKVFTELLAEAGMESPFVEETLRKVCRQADEWLKDFREKTGELQ
jgi:oligoendopeptidase F